MSPEERRAGAFEEFDELLSEGVPLEEAIAKAAEHNELRPQVFRAVAEKELGDLNAHITRVKVRASGAAHRREFLNAVTDYIGKFPLRSTVDGPPIEDWLKLRLDRDLTKSEREEALKRLLRGIRL